MIRSGAWAVVALLLAASLASPANGRSERGWPRPHRPRAASVATLLRRECLARCKSDYESDVSACSVMPRGDRKECRAEERWTRLDCVARCRR